MIQLHLGVLLLGVSGLFAKLINLPALDIIAYRSLFTVILLVAFFVVVKQSLRLRSKKDYFTALILGLLATGHWVTYFASIQMTSVAVGMLTLFTYPVITVVVEPLVAKRKPLLKDIVISVVVLFAISLLFPNLWSDSDNFGEDYLWGVACGLLSAVFFALRNIGIQHHFRHVTGSQSMFYQFGVAAVLLVPLTDTSVFSLSTDNLQLLLVFTLFFSAMPHVLFASSIAKTSAKTAGLVACLQPLYGILLSYLLLKEMPNNLTIIGGGIILLAAFYETSQTNKVKKLK